MRLVILLLLSAWCFCGTAAPLAVNDTAPEFSLSALDGINKVVLDDYKGKVVYLDFWASWCIPCRRSFPFLNKLKAQYADKNFEIISINLDQDASDAKQFLTQYPVLYPVAQGYNSDIQSLYNVLVMPTAYIIGKDGIVRIKHLGFKESQQAYIEAIVDKLVSEF
ncbi:MAG: thiol-disulfide isomerase/thioredoxin [Arenicella sp.]|jgi:thiol-disulfide isomerase/thioredoxin